MMSLRSALLARLAIFLPLARREWLAALLAERQAIDGRFARACWLAGGVRLALWVVFSEVRRNPRYLIEEALLKTVVATLSTVNVLAGIGLTAMVLFAEDVPFVVLAIAGGLLAQGGYTLLYLAGLLDRHATYARQLLLAGHSLALLAGLLGAAVSVAYNVNPPNGDNEYGPITFAFMMLTLALAALLSQAVLPERRAPSST